MSRYVDTYNLHKSLFEYKDQTGKVRTLPNRDCDNRPITLSVEEIKKAITKTPSADVAPVIHAHWIKDKRKMREDGEIYDYYCSRCKGEAIESQYGNHDVFTDFCPYCGAVMDEKEN